MMPSPAYSHLARFLNTLAEIPVEDLQSLLSQFTLLTLEKNQYYLRAGDVPQRLGFIDSGLLRMFYLNPEGEELTKSFCVTGEFVTSYSAMILLDASHLWIRAEQPTRLLTLDFPTYDRQAVDKLWWQHLTRRLIEHLYIKKERRERQFLLEDATARYQMFLDEYPGLEDQVPQYHIASYLGITPVSLSRIRTALKKLS